MDDPQVEKCTDTGIDYLVNALVNCCLKAGDKELHMWLKGGLFDPKMTPTPVILILNLDLFQLLLQLLFKFFGFLFNRIC